MAIDYIQTNWETLLSELTTWNTAYGNVLNTDITNAWNNALAAAQKYGDYVTALNSISVDIKASGENNQLNYVVGGGAQSGLPNNNAIKDAAATLPSNGWISSTGALSAREIIKKMYDNSQAWHSASDEQKEVLKQYNERYAAMLNSLGYNLVKGADGAWYIGGVGGEKLFDKYKQYIYHTGGIVGGGTAKENEQFALLEKGEWVFTQDMIDQVLSKFKMLDKIRDALSRNSSPVYSAMKNRTDNLLSASGLSNISNTTYNRPIDISIGDTIIQGGNEASVAEHSRISRNMVNEIARVLGVSGRAYRV